MVEYMHEIDITVELDEGTPVILIDIDGMLIDLVAEDAETFREMLDRAIDTVHAACSCGDSE